MRRLSLWLVGALLAGVAALAVTTGAAILVSRPGQSHPVPTAGGRTSPGLLICTYEFAVTNSPSPGESPWAYLVPLPFSGAYATLDSQGRVHETPITGVTPFLLNVTAEAVAFVILPQQQRRAGLELRQLASPGCTRTDILFGDAPAQLVRDPSATPNAATPLRGFRVVPLPGGVSTSCDAALLKALPWPAPPPGVPTPFPIPGSPQRVTTAPAPCRGSEPF